MGIVLGVIAIFILILAFAGFAFGPYLIEWFCGKLDEWEEIAASLKKEK